MLRQHIRSTYISAHCLSLSSTAVTSHWSSEGWGFDPFLGLRNPFFEIWTWRMCAHRYSQLEVRKCINHKLVKHSAVYWSDLNLNRCKTTAKTRSFPLSSREFSLYQVTISDVSQGKTAEHLPNRKELIDGLYSVLSRGLPLANKIVGPFPEHSSLTRVNLCKT